MTDFSCCEGQDVIEELTFFVPGHPAPQGSKRHVGNGRMIEQSKRLPAWRKAVTAAGVEALAGREGFGKHVALHVNLTFFIPRGKTVTRPLPTVTPDRDKLERAVNDALTKAGVWHDDAQVTDGSPKKRYADECEPGVHISIRKV